MKQGLQIRSAVQSYCAKIGCDSLLVQGAGGNVSWKENGVLWVKASGTWLKDALEQDIFVPVDLLKLKSTLAQDDFSALPEVVGETTLRPSIETLLHGLMPQTVVVHLHAIEVLSWLVRHNPIIDLKSKLASSGLRWTVVDYQKPGADLARKISIALREDPSVEIVFMANHGVVIGGESVIEVDDKLKEIVKTLSIKPLEPKHENAMDSGIELHSDYLKIDDFGIQQLAIDPRLFNRLENEWALYPDHLVFLGEKPFVSASWPIKESWYKNNDDYPDIIFCKGLGVFSRGRLNAAKQAQLRCYYDVLTRQQANQQLAVLEPQAISNLLNWDAEAYRQSVSK